MDEISDLLFAAIREGFKEALMESGILEELDFEGALVDALFSVLEQEETDSDLKKKLKAFLKKLNEE
jgi:hypothetical protein